MFIKPDCAKLCYSGRMDDSDKQAPVMVYPCSYVRMRFTGDSLQVHLENHQAYFDNYMGYFLDGRQGVFQLEGAGRQAYHISVPDRARTVHDFMLFKRMDACHHVVFYGFSLPDAGQILDAPGPKSRRMEFYGDSVSAGEVSEAAAYAGKEDPPHNGEYSNSWYSYAWITARKLDAELHDIAQGGAALMDRTGWFCEPDAVGMESIFDKIEYNPQLGKSRQWDFSKYTPHVVVIAIGQNDSHPDDYMAADPHGRKAKEWKQHYGKFVKGIRAAYPNAWIILATTILQHHVHWDQAVGEVCSRIGDRKVRQFCYRRNGCGTPGHIRAAEAEQMADELSAYIKGLGDDIWAG